MVYCRKHCHQWFTAGSNAFNDLLLAALTSCSHLKKESFLGGFIAISFVVDIEQCSDTYFFLYLSQ